MRNEAEGDALMNNWGTEHVKVGRSRSSTFEAFDEDVRRSVPGYELDICVTSGTFANNHAVMKQCGGELTSVLFGVGGYLGGLEFFQGFSTAACSNGNTFSELRLVDNATPQLIKQTVALPYLVPNCAEIQADELEKYESCCLRLLQKKLLQHMLDPGLKRVRVVLMECILSGNGGELREEFLVKLACLLKALDVVVIADEIMTGGRAGPGMTITGSLPTVWKERVVCITMGKWMGCGLLLRKATKNKDGLVKGRRGLSTEQELGPPHEAWKSVQKKIDNGGLKKRQQEVMDCFHLNNKTHGNPLITNCRQSEYVWGRGLLLFSKHSICKPSYPKGLKNRMLPRLQPKLKFRKGKTAVTSWTRSKMTKSLMSAVPGWQKKQVCHK